ncbi:hypothetical protein [Pseudomonas coronafaciens]|uniref:hypothetical protein n=1 Tax=Pseudomonas coronafaciens TaxID=53409 RepID=UPI0011C3E35A|nr:hypothetical protein [Pseudomonas coronafaciens]
MNISGLLPGLSKLLGAGSIAYGFESYRFAFQPGEISAIGSALAGCSATILGFLIAAVALMASVMDRTLVANLRATGGYQKLIFDTFVCTGLHLFLMASSLTLLLPWSSGKDGILLLSVYLAALAWITLVTTGAGLYRVIMRASRG